MSDLKLRRWTYSYDSHQDSMVLANEEGEEAKAGEEFIRAADLDELLGVIIEFALPEIKRAVLKEEEF